MRIDVRSHVTQAELAEARETIRLRGVRRDWMSTTVSTGLEAPERDGDAAYFHSRPVSAYGRRPALEIRDSITERRLHAVERLQSKSPAAWKDMIDKLRLAHPELTSSLTDAEVYRIVVERTSQDATERALKKKGRG